MWLVAPHSAESVGYQTPSLWRRKPSPPAAQPGILFARESPKGEKKESAREPIEAQIEQINQQAEALRQQAKEQETIGDRQYWPIYNLDIKNPNGPEEEVHDPDKLLAKYQKVLADIAATEQQLKTELSAALSHHLDHAVTK